MMNFINKPFFYKLENKKPVPCVMTEALENRINSNYVVKYSEITDNVQVSTLFMGIDLNIVSHPPLCFETLVMGGKRDGLMIRTDTWESAEEAHEKACLEVIDSV